MASVDSCDRVLRGDVRGDLRGGRSDVGEHSRASGFLRLPEARFLRGAHLRRPG